jgi:tetratricopeptide (TPR) repeat protein
MDRMPGYLSVLLVFASALCADRESAIQEALAALRRGDFAEAERVLVAEVKARPEDPGVLTLLGVALDGQKKFQEADSIHRRAAANAPNSPDVWNNYANHLLALGDDEGAYKLYLQEVALDQTHPNAFIQLAQLAVKKKNGTEALGYLGHVPDSQREGPNLVPLRLAAMYLAGATVEADKLAAQWLAAAKGDLGANFAIGLALAGAGKLDTAESFFTQALALKPSDFNTLFNLGVVEWRAGNYQRARELLAAAERQQPNNVDVLYSLACVERAGKRTGEAVILLVRAAGLASGRSDVQKELALATAEMGALDDSIAAWNRYLKLEPNDDVARRERGYTAYRMGRFENALEDLRWFVGRHSEDPAGHFELGLVLVQDSPAEALPEFNRAIGLNPGMAAAYSARGSVYYQMGKPEAALPDLEKAAALRPDDAVSLDRLGQTYLAQDRPADAVRELRKAVQLAPDDSKTLFHFARALADAGQTQEAATAMDRFRQLGPGVKRVVPGLVDYLSLTPDERHADYRKRVERVVHEHPEDAAAQVQYLHLLLEDGESQPALEVARKVAGLSPAAPVLAEAGRALLAAQEYSAARDILEKAAAAVPSADVEMDLAMAAFHASGPAEGTRLLDRIPESARGGEYYLARAEMLDAAGRTAEAEMALEQALHGSEIGTAVYLRGCAFLVRKGRMEEALNVSADAMKARPEDRRILLLRAVTLERAGKTSEARNLLQQIENRWPEWHPAWAADGIILGMHGRREDAVSALRTAVVLGANSAEVKRYLDDISTGTAGKPPDLTRILLSELNR